VQPSRTSGRQPGATHAGSGGTFLRSAGWAVLLDVEPQHPLVGRCWDRLPTTSDLDELLETLDAPDLTALVVVRESGVRRLVARGELALLLDGTDVLAARPAGATVDLPLAGVSTVEVSFTRGVLDGAPLPLRDGAAAAAAFRLVLDVPASDDRTREGDRTGDDDRTVRRLLADDTRPFVGTLTSRPDGGVPTATVRVHRPAVEPAPAPGDARTVDAPRVLAAVCPAGHLTPAYASLCRVCGRTVPAQEAFETARPLLGRLVLPQGTLLLDRGAVLGREPHVPRGWTGPQPHLVALADPDQDVSAQHVSLVLDLWNVLVCDLGSTNGTVLVDRSGRTTRLRPHEPAPLTPGGAVVLADVVTLPFEVQP
jgi:hypothetical protein